MIATFFTYYTEPFCLPVCFTNERQLLFMKGKIKLLMVLAAINPLSVNAQGIADIIATLDSMKCYHAEARFTVTMPQLPRDVVYNTILTAQNTAGDDPLAPCDYLIDWTLDTPSGPTKGFSAYFDGHHYRYRSQRLQEYHLEWDSIPFQPRGRVTEGVQQTAQFTSLLPGFIAQSLKQMTTDSACTVEFIPSRKVNGRNCTYIKATTSVNGTVTSETEYTFDPKTFIPLSAEIENNIGSLSEQTVNVVYSYPDSLTSRPCPQLNEEQLMALAPEAFERFRESNFKVENLPGTRLPQFSLPTTTGERYTHHTDEQFRAPTLIVILDPATGFNTEVVSQVRGAVDALPAEADVLWVFLSNNIDEIESIVPSIRPGEHLLMSGKGLARDLGVSSPPVIIISDTSAKVCNVIIGLNKELQSDVIQKVALIK